MTVVTLTGTSASPQTWVPPKDCPPGTLITIECWGAGSGGSGGNTTNRAGGAGGGYASTQYILQNSDVAGITYTLQAGGAGSAGANSTAGPDTTFGVAPKNLIPNSTSYGAVVGGAYPLGWTLEGLSGGLSNGIAISVVGFGTDWTTGNPLSYVDLSFVGTTTSTSFGIGMTALGQEGAIPSTPSVNYLASAYLWVTSGTMAGCTGVDLQQNYNTSTGSFVTAINSYRQTGTPPSFPTALTRYVGTASAPGSTATNVAPFLFVSECTAAQSINFTLRIAGAQLEQASAVTAYQSTPTSWTLGKGGGATSGTTGGVGPFNALCFGMNQSNGGSGATRTQGGGGGGAGGKAGAGASTTTATGGTADNGSGGAAGVSNVEGGGGATSGTAPGAGGAPGGGGGGNTSTGSGSAGGRGQVRITYTPTSHGPQTKPYRQRHMLMR